MDSYTVKLPGNNSANKCQASSQADLTFQVFTMK